MKDVDRALTAAALGGGGLHGLAVWSLSLAAVLSFLPASARASSTNSLALWGTIQVTDSMHRILGDAWFTGDLVMNNVRQIALSGSPLVALNLDGTVMSWQPQPYNAPAAPSSPFPELHDAVAVVYLGFSGGELAALQSDGRVAIWTDSQWKYFPELTEIVSIVSGAGHLVALRGDGTVRYWRFGLPGAVFLPTNLSRVASVTGGGVLLGIVYQDGSVSVLAGDYYYNDRGQTNVPPDLRDVEQLVLGQEVVAARKRDGTVTGWGAPEFLPPPGLQNIVTLAAGDRHLLALDSEGRVTAWGENVYRQTEVPAGLSGVVAIAAGRAHSVALRKDGSVVAWGSNERGQTAVPPGVRGVTAIAAWNDLTLAIGTQEPPVLASQPATLQIPRFQNARLSVETFGFGLRYEWFQSGLSMGPPSFDPYLTFLATRSRPGPGTYTVTVSNTAGSVVSARIEVTAADAVPGTVIAWNVSGVASSAQALIPRGLSNVLALAPGRQHLLALTADGTVTAWGSNVFDESRVPDGLRDVIAVDAHDERSVALRSDGTVVEWGRETHEQPPEGLGNVMAIAAGMRHTLALRRDGTVVAWGAPGDDTWQVPNGLREVIAIDAGERNSVALLRNGRVVEWGGPSSGHCPELLFPSDLQGVQSLWPGWQTTFALTQDFHVVARGQNCGHVAEALSGPQGFVSVAATSDLGVGLRADGKVMTWGQTKLRGRPNIVTSSWAVAANQDTVYEIVGPPVTPRLHLQHHPEGAALIWHAVTGREILHSADRLDSPDWRPVAQEPGRFNQLRRQEIPDSPSATYYRLQLASP